MRRSIGMDFRAERDVLTADPPTDQEALISEKLDTFNRAHSLHTGDRLDALTLAEGFLRLDGFDLAESQTQVIDLTIVIPMFREAARIGGTIATLASSSLHRESHEFVFVDDGSHDETSVVACEAIAAHQLSNARVLTLAQNVGKGGAIRAGVFASAGRYIAYLDADLSLNPRDVTRAFARLQATNSDIIVGERIVNETRQPRLRRVASGAFRNLASAISGVSATDPQCAMKIFTASCAKQLFNALQIDGFAFDVELLGRAAKLGYRIDELPIAWEHQSGSKVSPLRHGIAMYRELFAIRRHLRSG